MWTTPKERQNQSSMRGITDNLIAQHSLTFCVDFCCQKSLAAMYCIRLEGIIQFAMGVEEPAIDQSSCGLRGHFHLCPCPRYWRELLDLCDHGRRQARKQIFQVIKRVHAMPPQESPCQKTAVRPPKKPRRGP